METFTGISELILAVCLAMVIQNWILKKVSVNYIAMIIGILMALFLKFPVNRFIFEPEVFIGLVVAPLLFFEGQQNNLHSILRSWRSIFGITVIMIVIATCVAAFGVVITTGVSMPLALVLATISTPTDATATESVSHGLKLPKTVSKYLKNESLFNDASGLILLDMAVTWYVSKELNIGHTLLRFLFSSIGGLILGTLLMGMLVLTFQKLLRSNANFAHSGYEPITALITIYLIMPIMIYYLAEHIQVSGIIAVVAAGIVANAGIERSRLTSLSYTYTSLTLTRYLSSMLNGIVFVVLGIVIAQTFQEKSLTRLYLAILIGTVLYLANLLVRFLYSKIIMKLSVKDAIIFALGGIHGAVTFALAYMLEQTVISSSNFTLILYSEVSLIILSMIVPTILFRRLLPKDRTDFEKEDNIQQIKCDMVDYAQSKLNEIYLPKRIRKQLEFDLNAQIDETSMKDFIRELKKSVKATELTPSQKEFRDEVYRYAFREERTYLGQLSQKEETRPEFLNLYREVLLAEVLFLHSEDE